MPTTQRSLENLHWPDVAEQLKRPGATVVWPFGAVEQHGPQLPLSTDVLFADVVLDRVLSGLSPELPIWRLPAQAFGFSPEHAGFPGTLSLPADLVLRLVESIGRQLADLGVRRLVLFNAHGGQIGLLQVAARELRSRAPTLAVLPCFLWSGVTDLGSLIPEGELETGLHAGLAETSLMLALRPDLVGVQRPVDGDHVSPQSAAAPPRGWSLEGAAPCAWLTSDLSASGVVGDSRSASPELGQRLEQALVNHWQELFRSLLASEWPPVDSVVRS